MDGGNEGTQEQGPGERPRTGPPPNIRARLARRKQQLRERAYAKHLRRLTRVVRRLHVHFCTHRQIGALRVCCRAFALALDPSVPTTCVRRRALAESLCVAFGDIKRAALEGRLGRTDVLST
jgi:hypothetical protein